MRRGNYRIQEWDYEWHDWAEVPEKCLAIALASIYKELTKEEQEEFRKRVGNLQEFFEDVAKGI